MKDALKNLGIDVDAGKAKETGKKIGQNIRAGIVATDYDEVADVLLEQFNGVDAIQKHFTDMGYSNVKTGATFDLDGIKQYDVTLTKIQDGWKIVDKALIKIDPEVGHIITSTKRFSNELDGAVNSSKDLNVQADIYLERLKQMQVNNQAAFDSKEVQEYKRKLVETVELFRQGKVEREKVTLAQQELNTATAQFNAKLDFVNKKSNAFLKSFETAFNKVAIWFAGTTLFYGTLRQIQQMGEYVKDLNKELTNIQLVTGMSTASVRDLSDEFNQLAKELGATTLEVAQGSLEWFRQGKSIEETQQLLRDTILLSKLGNIDSATATEKLTAILNGYRLEAEKAIDVIDVLVALDNQYASSVDEISTAMQKSANSAQLAGVGYADLAAQITIISATTRKSAETIGESLKTIYARMQNVKLSKDVDEEGESISDVEEILSRYNITLRESNHEFRNMGDVLEDVAVKWQELGRVGDTVGQAAITNAIAGVRQRENLVALVANWDKFKEAQQIALESGGLATQRYTIYLDNIEAATNRFRAAWEKLATSITNSDLLLFFTDLGTGILNSVNSLGLLTVALSAMVMWLGRAQIATAFVAILNKLGYTAAIAATEVGTFTVSIGGATIALTAFQVVSGLIAFTALIVGFGALVKWIDKATQSITEFRDSFVDAGETFESNQSEIKRLTDRYEELANQTSLTLEDEKELLDIVTTLNGKYELVAKGVDLYSAALETNSDNKKKAIELTKELNRLEAEKFMATNRGAIDFAKDWMKTPQAGSAIPGTSGAFFSGTPKELLDQYAKMASVEKDINGYWHNRYNQMLENIAAYQEIIDKAEYYKKILNEIYSGDKPPILGPDAIRQMLAFGTSTEEATVEVVDFKDAISALQGEVSNALGIYKDYIDKQELSVDQIFKIIETYENYTELLIVENGQITLNTHALRLMTLAKIDDQIATLENQKIEGQLNVELVKRIAILQALRGEVVNSFNEIASARAEEERAASRSQEAEIRAKAAEIQEKAYQDLLKMTIDMLRQKKQAEIDALEAKLDAYKDIIDAEKRLLELKDEEYKYDKEKAEKNKTIADLEGELAELQFDDSQEATAKRLELEQQLAEAKDDLNELEHDRSVELSEDALDQEYSQYEEFINKKIDKLERYLSESGTITRDAMALLSSQSEALYQSLIEWNRQFGSGIDEDVVGAWQRAFNAMVAYAAAAQQISANTSFSTGTGGTPYSTGDQGNLTGKTIKLDNAYGTDVNVYGSSGATTPIDNIQEGRRYTVLDYDEGAKNPYKIRAEIDGRMQDVWVRSRNANFETYHTGLDAGAVGGIESKFGEVFVKALKGEYFVTPPQVKNFVTNVMPKSFEAMLSQAGGLQIDKLMEINVNGGVLDKSVMPDLESLADKVMNRLNTITAKRGHFRNANSYSV